MSPHKQLCLNSTAQLRTGLTSCKPRKAPGLGPVSFRSASTTPRQRLRTDVRQTPTFGDFLNKAQNRERRKAEERQQALRDASQDIPAFHNILRSHQKWPLSRDNPTVLQLNVGKFCNLNCRHCHVESGPTKTRENMDLNTVQRCLKVLESSPSINTVDITGGAPELNPNFRTLVREARAMGKTVIDRCNLVVLFEKGQEDLAEFLAKEGVNIVASLPCYTSDNTDKQRGKKVFDDSILALEILNQHGFGRPAPSTLSPDSLQLDLVYNPGGASLPPSQAKLEEEYKRRLWDEHGITFSSLYTLINMPIKRFADTLLQAGEYTAYMNLLANSFNVNAVDGLMCRNTVNVAWDGKIYDCDFNAALELGSNGLVNGAERANLNIWDIENVSDLAGGQIRIGKHCFGCTAGSGSSCGGALVGTTF